MQRDKTENNSKNQEENHGGTEDTQSTVMGYSHRRSQFRNRDLYRGNTHNNNTNLDNYLRSQNDDFRELRESTNQSTEWNRRFEPNKHYVYTDGSFKKYTGSGFGIYHGPSHPLNKSEKILGNIQDSYYAEIIAVKTALNDILGNEDLSKKNIVIRTDCLPLIQALDSGYVKKFQRDVNDIRKLCEKFRNDVEFQHVYSHDQNYPDPGNEAADILARLTISSTSLAPRRRDRSQEKNRSLSRSNSPAHIRSHSAILHSANKVKQRLDSSKSSSLTQINSSVSTNPQSEHRPPNQYRPSHELHTSIQNQSPNQNKPLNQHLSNKVHPCDQQKPSSSLQSSTLQSSRDRAPSSQRRPLKQIPTSNQQQQSSHIQLKEQNQEMGKSKIIPVSSSLNNNRKSSQCHLEVPSNYASSASPANLKTIMKSTSSSRTPSSTSGKHVTYSRPSTPGCSSRRSHAGSIQEFKKPSFFGAIATAFLRVLRKVFSKCRCSRRTSTITINATRNEYQDEI